MSPTSTLDMRDRACLGMRLGRHISALRIVSSAFEGLNTVKRHRLVYEVSPFPCQACCIMPHFMLQPYVLLSSTREQQYMRECAYVTGTFTSNLSHTVQVLKEELAGPVHALSLDTKTQEEAES